MSNIGKRFANPSVWEQPFFTELSNKQRLFWLYLNSRCDLAGVHQLHHSVDTAYLGFQVDSDFVQSFIQDINSTKHRVELISDHRLWLKDFVLYQQTNPDKPYLSSKSGPHISIVKKLKGHELFERAVEENPALYKEYTKNLGYDEAEDTLKRAYRKGYSNSNGSNKGNDSSYSSPSDSLAKAESILGVYPIRHKDGSDISLVSTVQELLELLETEGIANPVGYLITEIENLDRKQAPPPQEFFESLLHGAEIPF